MLNRPDRRDAPAALPPLNSHSPIGTECLLLIVLSVADLLLTYRLLSGTTACSTSRTRWRGGSSTAGTSRG